MGLLLAAALALLSVPARAELRAGAARRSVTPDLNRFGPVYIAGFGQNRVATGIHDELAARCLALDTGQKPLVICGVDSIGLYWDDVARVRERVAQTIPSDVIVAATHSHQTPDTMGLWGPAFGQSGLNEDYNRYVVAQIAAAAIEALRAREPAVACLAAANPPELKSCFDDSRPPVVHDPEILALSLAGRRGQAIGTLVNWANHPEALGSKNTLLSADYLAYYYPRLEASLGGVAVFVNGAVGGMQSPLGAKIADPATGQPAPKDSFRFAEILGLRVADLAAEAVKKAKPARIDRMEFRETTIRIPLANQGFQMAAQAGLFKGRKAPNDDGTMAAPVGYLRLGRGARPLLEAALVPGELYPELSGGGIQRYPGADFPEAPFEPPLKRMLRAPFRMLFGLADDEIGYILPKAEWDNQAPWLQNAPKRWYGEVNSVGPETAPRIAEAFRSLIR
ncbi:MAG: hypothetical protein HY822_11925 [Acidobacteria bacterium]|nr:hypothetical protein [Acidobacteriota bacterium]